MADLIAKQLSTNASLEEHTEIWKQENDFIAPIKLVIALFLISSNLMMLVGIWNTKNGNMSIPKMMFFSSAMCGLATGLFLPSYVVSGFIEDGCIYQTVSDVALNLANFLDFGKLISIGIVRFITLKYPLKPIATRKNIYAIWIIEFIFAASVALYGFFIFFSGSDIVALHRVYNRVYGIVSGSCILVTLILSALLLKTFWKQPTLLRTNNPYNSRVGKTKKALKRLLAIASVYMVCNLPITILCFLLETYPIDDLLSFSKILILINWFYSLALLYSGINSCIFMHSDRKILMLFKACIQRKKHTDNYILRESRYKNTLYSTSSTKSSHPSAKIRVD